MKVSRRKPITFTVNDRGCHICTSHAPNMHGYPMLWKDGRGQNMHRVLFEEANGPLEAGLVVRHTCDDRLCINIAHHVPGTCAQNTADITERSRHNPPKGERSGSAKLTALNVVDIRTSKESQKTLAARYGVLQSTISRIKSGARWTGEPTA